MVETQVFLCASNLDNPKKMFQGYCFVGSDYIFGEEGRSKFEEEYEVSIEGGEDGCYVVSSFQDDVYSFSCDYSGNKKIFYYWDNGFWVVSNSIFLIVEHLKKSGIFIKPNFSQLATISVDKGNAFNQIYSENTFVDNIKLLPVGYTLEVSTSNIRFVFVKPDIIISSYEEGLKLFISTWISRLAGLIESGVEIQSDLTGGADSRTVFALLTKAVEVAGASEKPKIRSGSTPDNDLDLRIATAITEKYDFLINDRLKTKIQRYSAMESYHSWKTLCLGVYHPVYFPNNGPNSNIVRLGGAGAENHRKFYKFDDPESFISYYKDKVIPTFLSYNVASDLKKEFKRINNLGLKVDPLVVHYRQYRNRMHSGRSPQYSALFNPLGCRVLDKVSELAGDIRIENGQLNYDLMASLLPSILDIPFDSKSKELNEIRQDNLTIVDGWGGVLPGKVFLSDLPPAKFEKYSKSTLDLLNEDFQFAKKTEFVNEYFSSDFIKRSEQIMEDALNNNRFPHATSAQGIVAIIAAGLFD